MNKQPHSCRQDQHKARIPIRFTTKFIDSSQPALFTEGSPAETLNMTPTLTFARMTYLWYGEQWSCSAFRQVFLRWGFLLKAETWFGGFPSVQVKWGVSSNFGAERGCRVNDNNLFITATSFTLHYSHVILWWCTNFNECRCGLTSAWLPVPVQVWILCD